MAISMCHPIISCRHELLWKYATLRGGYRVDSPSAVVMGYLDPSKLLEEAVADAKVSLRHLFGAWMLSAVVSVQAQKTTSRWMDAWMKY